MLSWVLPADASGRPCENGIDEPEASRWLRTAPLADQPYLVPSLDVLPRSSRDYPYSPTNELRDDVLACQSLVEGKGMEMLVLDQTRPDIGLPLVKVIVPGMRHFWARYAPGRQYDVPVQLGWLPQPQREDQLNPIPRFL
jgi:oxazoline/thiazoline synthase